MEDYLGNPIQSEDNGSRVDKILSTIIMMHRIV